MSIRRTSAAAAALALTCAAFAQDADFTVANAPSKLEFPLEGTQVQT